MKENIILNLAKFLGKDLNKTLENYINNKFKKVSIIYIWLIIVLLILGFVLDSSEAICYLTI